MDLTSFDQDNLDDVIVLIQVACVVVIMTGILLSIFIICTCIVYFQKRESGLLYLEEKNISIPANSLDCRQGPRAKNSNPHKNQNVWTATSSSKHQSKSNIPILPLAPRSEDSYLPPPTIHITSDNFHHQPFNDNHFLDVCNDGISLNRSLSMFEETPSTFYDRRRSSFDFTQVIPRNNNMKKRIFSGSELSITNHIIPHS
uniref:Uncharacterized protein n=1 Tax=Lepeophtheirus salmonis TaxID=72036 RepID=A0A0K2TT42_LEPSM